MFYDLFIFSLLCRVLKQLFWSFHRKMTASCKYHDVVDKESRGVTTISVSSVPLFFINDLPSIIYCSASVWYIYMIYSIEAIRSFIIPSSFNIAWPFSIRHLNLLTFLNHRLKYCFISPLRHPIIYYCAQYHLYLKPCHWMI